METIVIPKFISHYLIYTFLIVSIIEGIVINFGIQKKLYTPKGFLISAMLNFATTFSSFFVLRVIFFDNIHYNFLLGFILCVLIEFYFADFMLSEETTKKRLFVTILVANALSFGLVWSNYSWLF